jgi:hypothetical protein
MEETGEQFWVDPKSVDEGPQRSVLTDDQKARLDKIMWALKEHDVRAPSVWYSNFSKEARPDCEIEIYESVVKTYRQTLRSRPHTKLERRQLYSVLIVASACGTAQAVVSSRPELKSYQGLEDVVEAFLEELKN